MSTRRLATIGALIVLIGLALLSGLGGEDSTAGGREVEATSTTALVEQQPQSDRRISDLPSIELNELPPEALDTLDLIARGGPYPFDRDDLVFENREGLLPDRDRGHYREYTVITPGEDDRGARRIVAGVDGERYYTADHYASFRELPAASTDG
ncbi:MAG: ribonuclease domain-containing protein [Actinomycetota bacterium]